MKLEVTSVKRKKGELMRKTILLSFLCLPRGAWGGWEGRGAGMPCPRMHVAAVQ